MIKNKVMLVEDDSTMQAVLSTLLDIEGYQVSVAPDRATLEDLVQFIHDCRPDIVLLDVHLRQTSGLDVLRLIRADADITATRVVMSSGMDVKDDCIAGGANAFLMKPYMPDELLSKLRGE